MPGSLVGDMSAPLTRHRGFTAESSARGRLDHAAHEGALFFAFAVMADPVSSVAYAIEAALRALHGHLGLLFPTMAIVIGIMRWSR